PFQILKASDDSLLAEKVWGDANALTLEVTYAEVQFDTPVTINDIVRLGVYYPFGDSSNHIWVNWQDTDVKDDEHLTVKVNGAWYDEPTGDCAYRYKYYEVE
ncbi:unnamed protein product, partial [marine sediment metagenome]